MKRGRSARRDQKRIADLCLSSVRLSLCGSLSSYTHLPTLTSRRAAVHPGIISDERSRRRLAPGCQNPRLGSPRTSCPCASRSLECVIAPTAIANAERDGLAIPILAPPPRPPPTLLINPEYPSHHISR
ncbi:hypothetical protein GGG16DRAFT_120078 [Schizophyllum commune]